MRSRTLTLRGVPDAILKRLRTQAEANRRSLNSELLVILEAAARAGPIAPVTALPSPVSGGLLREAAPAYADAAAGGLADTSAEHAGGEPLLALDRDALAAVCRRHHIRRLDLFGSLAEGRARLDSDADVIAEFEAGRTPGFDVVRVAEALRPIFGGRRVDLFTPRELRRLRERAQVTIRALYAAG